MRDELAGILIPAELQNHLRDIYKYRFVRPHQMPRIRLLGAGSGYLSFVSLPSHFSLLGQVRKPL